MKNLETLQNDKDYKEGMDWLSKQDATKALLSFEKAVRANPQHYIAWNNIGVLLFHASYHQEAEKAFRKALEMEPAYVDALVNLFDLYKSKNKLAEARGVVAKLKVVDPANSQIAKMESALQA